MNEKDQMSLFAVAVPAAECSKENNDNSNQRNSNEDDNNEIQWTAAGPLGVVKTDGSAHVQFNTKADDVTEEGRKAKFMGSALTEGAYYAYYPYQANAPINAENALSLEGQTQDGQNEAHLQACDLLLSSAATIPEGQADANFAFAHKLSRIQFGVHLKDRFEHAYVIATSLTLKAHCNGYPMDVFAKGVYFDPATGEVRASAWTSEVTLAITNGTGLDWSFTMNLMLMNRAVDWRHANYTIDAEVNTSHGLVKIEKVREVRDTGSEFQPGKLYKSTHELDMRRAQIEIPDREFREYLRKTFDFRFTNSEGKLTWGSDSRYSNDSFIYIDEHISSWNDDRFGRGKTTLSKLSNIYKIDCSYRRISDLKGIEYFSGLNELRCCGNSLTSLDLSKNTRLDILECSANQLASLDITPLAELHFFMGGHQTTGDMQLELTPDQFYGKWSWWKNHNPGVHPVTGYIPDANFRAYLATLGFTFNGIKIDKDNPKNTDLLAGAVTIDCSERNISDLRGIEYFPNLTKLHCHKNGLTGLDLSQNTKLTELQCYSNQLTGLDVSHNTELTSLRCYSNQLTGLDLSKNTKLTELCCDFNRLTGLDLSQNKELSYLWCCCNQFPSLDISSLERLDTLMGGDQMVEGKRWSTMTLHLSQGQFNGKWKSKWEKNNLNTHIAVSVKP